MERDRKKALLLVHRIPYPPNKGDKIRSWQLFQYLATRFDLSVGFFVDDENDHQYVDYLSQYCASIKAISLDKRVATLKSAAGFLTGEPLSLPYYRSKELESWVRDERAKGLDLEMAFSSSMAPYLRGFQNRAIVDLVDADSAKWLAYGQQKNFPLSYIYQREGKLLAQYEAELTQQVDQTFLISPAEVNVVKAYQAANTKSLNWYGNGVDTDYFSEGAGFTSLGQNIDLVFTGAMDYWANVDAINWFMAEVWSELKAQRPDLTLAIVGANPTTEVRAHTQHSGVQVTGRVEDVRPWIAAANVSIAPLRIARGVQNKVLEAMAMSKHVVATPQAAEGIDVEDGKDISIGQSPSEFSQIIDSALETPTQSNVIGQQARARVEQQYGWAAQFERLSATLRQLQVM